MCRSNCSYLSVDRNCRSRHRMSNIDCGRRPSGDPTYGYVGIGGSFLYHSKISMPSSGHGSGAGISDSSEFCSDGNPTFMLGGVAFSMY